MPRVNLDRAPTSLAALNGLLARTGYDIQIVRGNGYYFALRLVAARTEER